jgi:hypothetical protein
MDAVLAFAAALVSLRLSADLARRFRRQKAPQLAAWCAALAAYAVAAGALAWGAADGWSAPAFRVYYAAGALLTAPLLGAGSLLLTGRRWAAALALAYAGLAIGVAIAVPLHGDFSGTEVPSAQDVLAFSPARLLAIVANSVGTLLVVAVALATLRRRAVGNVLILAGVAVAAVGSGLGGLGVGGLAPFVAGGALLLYAGFVTPAAGIRDSLSRALRPTRREPSAPRTRG